MRHRSTCPACARGGALAYPALVSGFIASYVLRIPRSGVDLLECPCCGLRYYAQRFSDAQARSLYLGYRAADYFAARHANEFWYTEHVNAALEGSVAAIDLRNRRTLEFLSGYLKPSDVEKVLDFGGDRGQFIPRGLGHQRWVYDVSGAKAVEGVGSLTRAQLRHHRFDMVLLANVLEHAPNPAALLNVAHSLTRNRRSFVLVSVPMERPSLAFIPTTDPWRTLYVDTLRFIAARPKLACALEFYSALFRVKVGVVPPLGFLAMHEHINFFTLRSLKALLERVDLEPVHEATLRLGPSDAFPTLLCLSRRRL